MSSLWTPLRSLPQVAESRRTRAAVLVPLYEDDGELRVVLTKRPDDMRSHPGDVVFPGGMIEPHDEGPVDAAIREASEEVALPRENVLEILGGLTTAHTRSVTMTIVPVVARIERPTEFVPEPGEVDIVLEPRVSELLDDDDWRVERWWGRRMWFYDFPEGILWGATAFMMRELLDYLRPE